MRKSKMLKLFLVVCLVSVVFSCRTSDSESDTKKLKPNFYGKASESGKVQASEAENARSTMADKTIVLTFDDGPASETERLVDFLDSKGVNATFFVIGKFLKNSAHYRNVMKKAAASGHILANHTLTHTSATPAWLKLPDPSERFRDELLASDDLLTELVGPSKYRFFRPPGGYWEKSDHRLIIDHPRFKYYYGPVGWNMGGSISHFTASDHECWTKGMSLKACADLYFKEISSKRKGIALFHDNHKKTIDMFINYLYPQIEAAGYKIIPLSRVPYYSQQIEKDHGPGVIVE